MTFFADRFLTVIRGHHFKLTVPTVNSRPININDILYNRIILPVIIPEACFRGKPDIINLKAKRQKVRKMLNLEKYNISRKA